MTANPIPEAVVEAVARAICMACEENPDRQGDARGNEFRWQDYRDTALAAISALAAAQAQPKRRRYDPSGSLSEYGVFPECDAQQPAEGEDIMVDTPYDVFILPLRPSGLDGKSPRFVVHVPGPEAQAAEARGVVDERTSNARGEVEYEYEVWQGDALQAGGSTTDYASAQSEASHYAMMYNQDGPVEIIIYEKRRVAHARRSQQHGVRTVEEGK